MDQLLLLRYGYIYTLYEFCGDGYHKHTVIGAMHCVQDKYY